MAVKSTFICPYCFEKDINYMKFNLGVQTEGARTLMTLR